MSKKYFNRTRPEITVNGCILTKPSKRTEDFDFCSDIVYLYDANQIGIEFNFGAHLRIHGVITTGMQQFRQMMELWQISRDVLNTKRFSLLIRYRMEC